MRNNVRINEHYPGNRRVCNCIKCRPPVLLEVPGAYKSPRRKSVRYKNNGRQLAPLKQPKGVNIEKFNVVNLKMMKPKKNNNNSKANSKLKLSIIQSSRSGRSGKSSLSRISKKSGLTSRRSRTPRKYQDATNSTFYKPMKSQRSGKSKKSRKSRSRSKSQLSYKMPQVKHLKKQKKSPRRKIDPQRLQPIIQPTKKSRNFRNADLPLSIRLQKMQEMKQELLGLYGTRNTMASTPKRRSRSRGRSKTPTKQI